jgi:hypothetical protein
LLVKPQPRQDVVVVVRIEELARLSSCVIAVSVMIWHFIKTYLETGECGETPFGYTVFFSSCYDTHSRYKGLVSFVTRSIVLSLVFYCIVFYYIAFYLKFRVMTWHITCDMSLDILLVICQAMTWLQTTRRRRRRRRRRSDMPIPMKNKTDITHY